MINSIMPMPSEVLGQSGLFRWLDEMQYSQPITQASILDSMQKNGVGSPDSIFDQMLDLGIIIEESNRFVLSSYGRKAHLLLGGINGEDLREVVRHLSQLEPSIFPYDIVREGMTSDFISSLEARPDFRRIYICSPWISLKRKIKHKLILALYKAQELREGGKIDLLIIARPLHKTDPAYEIKLETFRTLENLGAEIVVHKDLHAKIYIREPGSAGGLSIAVFGSENLTGTRNIELGIKITNDTELLHKLVAHFYDIYSQCEPWNGE
jgi:hypothetical protein